MKQLPLFFTLLLLQNISLNAQVKLSSATFGAIEARCIGPAVMSGRITAIEGVNSNPKIIYVGAASGGVWKSTTAGMTFEPVFEKYPQSIGALAIDQDRPDTVWVGTGESNMRNSVSIGLGIFRSTDGGRNWTKMGLEKSEHISKIIIHPLNPNVLYVAAPGALWSDSLSPCTQRARQYARHRGKRKNKPLDFLRRRRKLEIPKRDLERDSAAFLFQHPRR
jgi:hypothetical protein